MAAASDEAQAGPTTHAASGLPLFVLDLSPAFAGAPTAPTAVVLLNYACTTSFVLAVWATADLVIAADGAATRLFHALGCDAARSRHVPNFIVGDCDSIDDATRCVESREAARCRLHAWASLRDARRAPKGGRDALRHHRAQRLRPQLKRRLRLSPHAQDILRCARRRRGARP